MDEEAEFDSVHPGCNRGRQSRMRRPLRTGWAHIEDEIDLAAQMMDSPGPTCGALGSVPTQGMPSGVVPSNVRRFLLRSAAATPPSATGLQTATASKVFTLPSAGGN